MSAGTGAMAVGAAAGAGAEAEAAAVEGREAAAGAGGRANARLRRPVPLFVLLPVPVPAVLTALLLLAAGCAAPLPTVESPEPAPIPPVVQTPPPVPKPAPGAPVETWSVSVEDVPVRELLFALARDARVDMDVDPGIEGRITMNAVEEPLPALLERISRHADVRVEIEDGALVARRDEPVLRTYPIDYVSFVRETATVNELGTGVGSGSESGVETPAGEENGSTANVTAKAEHRFWDTLVESVRGVLGEGPEGPASVFAHRETSLIAVRASAARHREVALLLDRILASARRQVLIEATIVEIDLDDRFRAGVDFSRMFGDASVELNFLDENFVSPSYAGLSISDLSLTIRLLSEFGDVRVLSTPLVMALNNQTAIVKIAENRVFFTSEVRTETRDSTVERNVRTRLHTVPVGLILLLTPSVAADDEIILKIRPTVTRQSGFVRDPNPELTRAGVESLIPVIAVREIESVLRLRSGEVAVLGGLMREEEREDTTGVPFLSRLPGVGAAFRYRDRAQDKTELIVFLRPTVVREPALAGDLAKYRRWWPSVGGRSAAGEGARAGVRRRGRTPEDPTGRPSAPPRPGDFGRGRPGPAPVRSFVGREPPGRAARPGVDGARARRPPHGEGRLLRGAGRAPGGCASRPRRRRAPRGKGRGGPRVVPAPRRPRPRERGRADPGVRARPRAGPDRPRAGACAAGRVRPGDGLAPGRARKRPRRTGQVGGGGGRLPGRPPGRAFEPRPGVQPRGQRGPARPAPAGPGPLPRRARARRPLAPRLRRAGGPRAGRGARRADRGRPMTARAGAAGGSSTLDGLDHLGTLLVETGAISEDQARIALTEQSNTGTRFADVLVKLGFVTEAIIRDAVGGALGVESVDLGRTVAEPEAMAAIPEPVARRFLAVGLTLTGGEADEGGAPRRLTVAMADPFDVIALDHLRSLFDGGMEIVPLLAGRADLERFLERAWRHDLSVTGILREIETGEAGPGGFPANADEYSQPIVRLVDVLLSDAVKRGASDVHFEPEAGFLRVRYRIDGVLRQVRSLHRDYWSAIAVRLKVLCGMNIAETRAPQDGRMTLSVSGHDIDYRVSSLPTAHGENIVLRVLDRSRGIVALDELGMSPGALAELRRMMERPEG